MSTASTSFPSYASQVVCQGFNLRKCIKNIYKAGKACLYPFFKSRTRKKVIWDVSCEVMPLPIFNTKQLFLFSFGQVGNVQGPHNSPQAYCGLLASPTFSNLRLAERKWKQLLRRLTWNANECVSHGAVLTKWPGVQKVPILSVPNETESATDLNSLSGQLIKVIKNIWQLK